MLSGPAEALVKLLEGEGAGRARISSSSGGIKTLRNGIRYFAVQVSLDGVDYGISAYDEEAIELFMVAKGRYILQEKEEASPVPVVAV